jgi:hypothetical protein
MQTKSKSIISEIFVELHFLKSTFIAESMHQTSTSAVRIIDSAPPIFDIPTEEKLEEDINALEVCDSNNTDLVIGVEKKALQSIIIDSGIVLQFAKKHIELDDTTFLQPDVCTIDDWNSELDSLIQPNAWEKLSSREFDQQIVELLTNMAPKEHYMQAATFYMQNSKQWSTLLKNPLVEESCHCLGMDISVLQPRSLESFQREPHRYFTRILI